MKTATRWLMIVGLTTCAAIAQAGAPLPLDKIAPADDLAVEVEAKVTELTPWLASAEAYRENVEKLRQGASLLAVLGQALAEHPQPSKLKSAGPALRDAAMALARSKTFDDATAAWPKLQAAAQGQADDKAVAEFDWAKLTRMHPAMEEMNARATQLRRLLRRPKDPAADSRHAASIALLAVAAHADVHEVKNPADTPQWHAYAAALHQHMVASAAAIRAKDTAEANKQFLAGMETCNKCHEAFNQN